MTSELSPTAKAFHDELWHWLESEDEIMTAERYAAMRERYGTDAEQEVRDYLQEDGVLI